MTDDSLDADETSGLADDASLSPDKAFAVLGDDIRIAILRALFEDPYEPKSFSELRETVGVRDSGQFNYHLDKLVGRFVRKTEEVSEPRSEARGTSSHGGYELRLAGWKVVGAILAGTYTESGEADPTAFEHPCPECGGVVVATYEDERMRVACEDCDEKFSAAGVPPGVLDGFDPEELPERFDHYMHAIVDDARRGICVSCTGRMVPEVVVDSASAPNRGVADADFPLVAYRCERCPEIVTTSLGAALLDHPAVVAFHWDHGIDLRERPTWTLPWMHDDYATVESEEPVRVRVVVELGDDEAKAANEDEGTSETDGDRLELVVDERANVIETVRR